MKLLLVALLLVAGASATSKYKNRRLNDISNNDDIQQGQTQKAQPFRSGYEYVFKYDGQIVSGLDVTGPNSAPVKDIESQQSAATRIQAQAKITFESDRQAVLRLQNVKLGQLNQPIETPQQVQPMGMFQTSQIENKQRQKLEYPLQFDYSDGIVESIQFHNEDPTWSRNMKRAILNLIQLNLKKQPVPGENSQSQQSQLDSAEQRDNQQEEENQSPFKSFTTPEITIEGECQTTYTISKNKKRNQQSNEQSDNEQSSEQQSANNSPSFNVTKSIDFKKCRQIVDVAFGYQNQQQQPQCVKCKQVQNSEEEQAYGPQQQSQMCSEECDPKEIKEQKVDRTTVLRFVLNGQKPDQEYGIKQAELLSQYVVKNLRADSGSHSSAMQTVVAARLVFKKAQPKQEEQGAAFSPDNSNNQKNTLMYDNEFDVDEKRFYMFGEKEFSKDNLPFANVQDKTEQAQQILQRLLRSVSDKSRGMESKETAELQRLVELLRMCTVSELKQIYKEALSSQSSQRRDAEQQKTVQLLADSMAIAGTHNTISVLSKKILESEISAEQASQALKQLSSLPAPSDQQADLVLNVCQNDLVQRNKDAKQTCWLTFGSMVGELCQQKRQRGEKTVPVFGTQSGFISNGQCTSESKEKYKQALVNEYEQSKNSYDQTLALKSIGNAGMDITVHFLEQIASSRQENPLNRANAIDAMRRLRTQMPRKIQRVLLPILQDTRDQPAVRMMAFYGIIQTTPQQPILDQVTYTLSKERNPQVQSLIYSVLKAMSKSKVPSQQEIAKHLKNTLALANVDEESLQASGLYQIPIYSDELKEGAFLNLVSAYFNRNTILPNQIAATTSTFLNNELEMNALGLVFTQQGLEQWYEGFVRSIHSSQGQSGVKTRAERSSANPREQNKEKLRGLFSGLNIKSRKSLYRQQQDDDSMDGQDQKQNWARHPLAIATVRVGDVDTSILEWSLHSMPACLKNLANGKRFSLSECVASLQDRQHFHYLKAMNLKEKAAKIPTSLGVPLRISQSLSMLANLEGSVVAEIDRSEGTAVSAQVKAHSAMCAVHTLKMDTWTPIVSTGVQSTHAVELNIPINAQIRVNDEASIKVTMKTPSTQTRFLGFHSLPSTYVCQYDARAHLLKEPQLKTIHVQHLEQFQREIDYVYGREIAGMPIRNQGHVHLPANPTDYKQLVQLAMATENHFHMVYEANPNETPKEIIFHIQPSAFNKEAGRRPSLGNFYTKDNSFDAPGDEFDEVETHEQRRSKLNTFSENFQPSHLYKHQLAVSVETKGERKVLKAQATGSASCDKMLKYCYITMNAKRSPMFAQEHSEWTMESKLQILTPEAVSNVQQLQQRDDQKNQKLIVQGETKWGTGEQKQSISLRIQGEKAHTKQWRKHITEKFQDAEQKFQEKQTAFVNKFDFVAEYNLQPQSQSLFHRACESLRSYSGFWNTHSQYQQNRNGQIRGTVVIDPITQKYANISVKTPTQVVRMEAMELPIKARPFPLVRPAHKSARSMSQMMNRLAVHQARAECSVDGKRVETFDDVAYKAPIGKCYSVLAQDCSNQDQPQFSVLMKTLRNGQDKKIMVVTPEQTIECQPRSQGQQSEKKLICSVNGQTIEAENDNEDSQQNNQGSLGPIVEYNNDEQTDVNIQVEGVQVRFGCWGSQGCKNQKAWIKLSSQYKEGQCGLCGHYDDQQGDEWRTADNQLTEDLKKFARSYSVRGIDNEDCSNDEENELYSESNNRKFQRISQRSDEDWENQQDNDEQFNGKRISKKNQQNQWDNEESDEESDNAQSQWQAGAYHTDESSSEEDQWGRHSSMKRYKKAKQNKGVAHKQKNNQENADYEDEPVQATKVLEHAHKVCFSMKPVKQCPSGTHRAQQSEEEQQSKSVAFACIPRSDNEARRMERRARQGEILDMSSYSPSLQQDIREPTACTVY